MFGNTEEAVSAINRKHREVRYLLWICGLDSNSITISSTWDDQKQREKGYEGTTGTL